MAANCVGGTLPPMPIHHQLDATLSQIVVDRMADGVVVQGADGSILMFNASALAVLDLTSDQLLGRTSTDPSWMAVDTQLQPFPGERHPAMRCVQTGQEQRGVIMGVRTPTHAVRWLLVDSYPVDLDGERGALTLFADITAEHNADDEVRARLRVLQQAFLPSHATRTAKVEYATWYRAAGGRAIVGGDFFDVVEVGDESTFFIGDIAGHDIDAVAATALARYTLRAAAVQRADPPQALRLLHDSLLTQGDGHLCTALFGIAEQHTDGLRVTVSSAGHPAPFLVAPNRTETVALTGPLLGSRLCPEAWPSQEFTLRRGELLFCYTDGLTDTVRPRLEHDRLAGMISWDEDPAALIETVLRALPGTWDEAADDIAILSLTGSD